MTRGAVGALVLVAVAAVIGVGALVALRPGGEQRAASSFAATDERGPEVERPLDERMVVAQRDAREFLSGFLDLTYGRAGVQAGDLRHASSALIARLRADRARVTPAQQAARPRVVGVALTRTGAQRASATTSVQETPDAMPYGLSFQLQDTVEGWLVTSIGGG